MTNQGYLTYLDFDLAIETVASTSTSPSTGSGRSSAAAPTYRARVLNSPAGQAACDFAIPFAAHELENYILKMGRPRRSVRSLHTLEGQTAREFGERLFDAVFQGEVRDALRRSLDAADAKPEHGLRIRLRLADAPALLDLPWEYLYDPTLRRFFSHSVATPVVRYPQQPRAVAPLTVTPPLQVLVMIANPSDVAILDVEEEWRKISAALAPLVTQGLVQLTRLENATLATLQRQLRQGHYHIFHFVGHGGLDPRGGERVLFLEDEQGRSHAVSGDHLGTLLCDHRSLRLVLLNACEGARSERNDPFAGVAQHLVHQGIPAIIAMQFEITDAAAITLAQEFYAALADGYPVEAALAEARKAIFVMGNDVEWGTPVLYSRASDGLLFRVAAAEREAATELRPERVEGPVEAKAAEPTVTTTTLPGRGDGQSRKADDSPAPSGKTADTSPEEGRSVAPIKTTEKAVAEQRSQRSSRNEPSSQIGGTVPKYRTTESPHNRKITFRTIMLTLWRHPSIIALLMAGIYLVGSLWFGGQLATFFQRDVLGQLPQSTPMVTNTDSGVAALAALPTATATPSATPNTEATTAAIANATDNALATITAVAKQAATDTAATLIAQPTDTLTPIPQPTHTTRPRPTATATPMPTATHNAAATTTAAAKQDAMNIAATRAAQPTATLTPTPQPTATATPVLSPTPADGDQTTVDAVDMTFVYVSAGPFLMGSPDGIGEDDEHPQFTMTTDAYWIGLTEVTNAQYQHFLDADSYNQQAWWTDAGWQWRTANVIKKPSYWTDSKWNGANQPVVGVSWYEATAYATWLAAETGLAIRLPTEAEWEKAARGVDGQTYPWSDDEPNDQLLRYNSWFGPTVDVGSYPDGASPYGALDMACNVWEWNATQWVDNYDNYSNVVYNGNEGDATRAVRGGSWFNDSYVVRSANRLRILPVHGLYNFGFRLVFAPGG